MEMSEGLGHLDRHRYHVECRIDALSIRTLVARNVRLRHERVHDAPEMTLPRVGGAAQQGAASPKQEACPLQRGQRANDRGRVARDNARRFPPECARVIGLGVEGVAGNGVRLAAFHDELDASPAVRLRVLGTKLLRRTIDDNVDSAYQIVQRSGYTQASLLHGPRML